MAQQFKAKWSDKEWIRRLKEGNQEATEEMLTHLLKWARFAVEGDLNEKSDAWEYVVYDGAVDALIRIINRLQKNDDVTNFQGFCKRVVTNRVLTRIEAWDRRNGKNSAIDESMESSLRIEAPSVELSGTEIYQLLEPCLNQLKPRERQIIELYYLNDEAHEELTYKAVGEQLGITGTHVGKILYYTLRKLKECLEKQGYSREDLF